MVRVFTRHFDAVRADTNRAVHGQNLLRFSKSLAMVRVFTHHLDAVRADTNRGGPGQMPPCTFSALGAMSLT